MSVHSITAAASPPQQTHPAKRETAKPEQKAPTVHAPSTSHRVDIKV